jgi:hypothetical protein
MNVVMLEALPFAASRALAMVGKEVLPAAPVVLLASPMGLPAAAPAAGAVVFAAAGAVVFASGAVLVIAGAVVAIVPFSMPACSKMRPADAVDSTAHRHRSVTKRAIVKLLRWKLLCCRRYVVKAPVQACGIRVLRASPATVDYDIM